MLTACSFFAVRAGLRHIKNQRDEAAVLQPLAMAATTGVRTCAPKARGHKGTRVACFTDDVGEGPMAAPTRPTVVAGYRPPSP